MHMEVETLRMDTSMFSPVVLKCSLLLEGYKYPKGYQFPHRFVYDYELEYIIESDGLMGIEGQYTAIKKGDVVFRKPGQYVQGIPPYNCYLICFDLLGNTGKDPNTYDFGKTQGFQTCYSNPVLNSIPGISSLSHTHRMEDTFDRILEDYIENLDEGKLRIKADLLGILYRLYTNANDSNTSSDKTCFNPYYCRIQKVTTYINANIHMRLTLTDLAELVGLSPNYLHRVFTETMGATPNEYIISQKMSKAKELLIRSNHTITEIALLCGFDNIPYFSTVFKKYNHKSPNDYRRAHTRF